MSTIEDKQIDMIRKVIEYFRARRKTRSLDFVLYEFNEMAERDGFPEHMAVEVRKAIENPEATVTFKKITDLQ